ncbi:hypothetical protein BCF46_0538 [Litoreibacter meonggei]|uniref:Uncharacterized protein n=1 Tax=Litoreibacter meonggei TaxID=1049199 RepID=A0A497X547_9RHOB|nr:hypothetical protein BCF46_0538 [Litoreibacter meonggei]
MRGCRVARGHMGHAVHAVMLFNDPFQVAGRIGVRLRQPECLRAQLGTEPTVFDMAAQVDELAHQQAPVVIAASGVAGSAFERVMWCPRHLHKFVSSLTEVQVAHADAAVLTLSGNATVGFAGFGRSGTH